MEDMSKIQYAASVALKHYIVRRISNQCDVVTRFGERSRVGSAVIALVVNDMEQTCQVAWRGDCIAMDTQKRDLITTMHKPVGGLSLEIGRFMGSVNK